jgi:hypothetical protein
MRMVRRAALLRRSGWFASCPCRKPSSSTERLITGLMNFPLHRHQAIAGRVDRLPALVVRLCSPARTILRPAPTAIDTLLLCLVVRAALPVVSRFISIANLRFAGPCLRLLELPVAQPKVIFQSPHPRPCVGGPRRGAYLRQKNTTKTRDKRSRQKCACQRYDFFTFVSLP